MELGATMLQKVLGGAEKTLANNVYCHSLLDQVNQARKRNSPTGQFTPMTKADLVARGADLSEITSTMKSHAMREVNDMIATGVTSKKGQIFQQNDNVLREMLRMGAVLFSNHQVHLAANSVAARDMIRFGDAEARARGRRLLATNVTQNVLFRLTKYTMATFLLTQLIGALGGWDDDEKDSFYAKFFGIDVENPDEQTLMRWIALTLGGTTPLGWDSKTSSFSDAKKNQSAHRAVLDVSMEFARQTPLGNLGLIASTNFGGMIATPIMSKAVDPLIPGSPSQFNRAGYTMEGADLKNGVGLDNMAYNASSFFLNDLANMSLVAGGLSQLIDPMVMISNAEEVQTLDAALLLFGSAPFVPREFQSKIEKGFTKKTDAKIWDAQWRGR
jgi:hypothetical protein